MYQIEQKNKKILVPDNHIKPYLKALKRVNSGKGGFWKLSCIRKNFYKSLGLKNVEPIYLEKIKPNQLTLFNQ